MQDLKDRNEQLQNTITTYVFDGNAAAATSPNNGGGRPGTRHTTLK
jgi:hypothetical protein